MRFAETNISGALLIQMEPRRDDRGYFARMWCAEELRSRGLCPQVAQINTGFSPRAGTLRGLHFQVEPHSEVKIVRCLRGAVYDVIVDLRPGSATRFRWEGFTLTADSEQLLYVPKGCAHGYLTLEDRTELMYLTSTPYAPTAATGVRFDDPALGIVWPRSIEVVSEADRSWPSLESGAASL